jgi:tetratricopeptide (TPR) repeat protein
VEAWEIYLRGLALDQQIGDTMEVGRIKEVIALFDRAVEIDPTFADAHLMLADLWETQVNPTSAMYALSDLPLADRRARFKAALVAAIDNARSEATRLEAEMRSADFDLRFMDQIELAKKMVELEPEKRDGWSWLNYLYTAVGEFEKSREAGLKAWAAPEEPGSGNGPIIQSMHRVSLPDALMMVDEVLSSPNPTWSEVYQSHRALLAAGENERAAVLVERYLNLSNDADGIALMKMRQACAEGRVADADKLFEAVDTDSNSRWLFLKTLGRDAEAHELLAGLDTPDSLGSLASYLTYLSFEPRNYPLLWKTLTDQGIDRPPARPLAYRCDR